MNRHGTLAGVLALGAALLIGSPASSADPERKNQDLQKEVSELREELAALKKMQALDSRATTLALRLINERLDGIENALSRMAPPAPRISSSFTPPAPPATGTLRLDNRLGVNATVYVDGVPYTVPPFSVRTLAGRPAGALVYEATADGRGMGPPVRSSLGANETMTVTIY
jgi:hypothetical protein